MYKLLIIDDEKLIREGLINYINWSELNIEVIGTASNGELGLTLIQDLQPDIILSDIHMPQLDGISLIKKIRELELSIEVIFISAYSDFKYAQSAVKFGAFDYLLKPIEEQSLYHCAEKCIKKISQTRSKVELLEILDSNVRSNILTELLMNNVALNAGTIDLLNKNFGIHFVAHAKSLLTLYLSTPSDHTKAFHLLEALPLDNLYKIKISEHLYSFLFCYSQLSHYEIEYKVSSILKRSDFEYSMQDCKNNDFSMCYHNNLITLLTRISPAPSLTIQPLSNKDIPLFRTAIATLNGDVLINALYNNYQSMIDNKFIYSLDKVQCEITFFMHIVLDEIQHLYGHILENSLLERYEIIRQITQYNNFYELFKYLQQTLVDLLTVLKSYTSKSKLAFLALQYIHSNYSSAITLCDVANHLNVSAPYLSKLFKESNNTPFSDYLLHYRILEAKELLKQGTFKVYEVANKVGYTDVVQFTKMFKKITGVTPKNWVGK